MKRCVLLSVLCFLYAVLLPTALFQDAARAAPPELNVSGTGAEKSVPAPATAPTDEELRFSFLDNGTARTVTMAEYLPGVVAGEMPAAFDMQALRAQAVAARTYTLYHMEQGRAAHPGVAVCDDPGCCQVWQEEPALREKWGVDYDYYMDRILTAVESTSGQYLSYNDAPILACFHSSSPGRTQTSQRLWGQELPYLVSVSSPETAETVPNLVSTVELSPEEFRTLAEAALPQAAFPDQPDQWLGERILDDSGRVASQRIGSEAVPGTTVRDIYGLRSACFAVEWTGRSFLFTVSGYGHGAGMSQYGANVMAKNGSDYTEILAHYYPGTELIASQIDN